ncbi:MAG: hypothetical protein WAW73_08890 [Rhodoferax sp.]
MSRPPQSHPAQDCLTSFFWSGDAIRSRSVSDAVMTGVVSIPAPPPRLVADWERDISERLESGDVDVLPLARARVRWPDYKLCVQAVSEWTRSLGLHDVLVTSDVALMACRGAKYHHDAAHYGGAAFCNLFLSEDRGLDVHFPATGLRIPLTRGTVMVFDTGHPHAVIARHGSGFHAADFSPEQDCSQVFLTWELPIENPDVAQLLGVVFDIDPENAARLDEEQIWLNGGPARVCPDSGRLWSDHQALQDAARDRSHQQDQREGHQPRGEPGADPQG